MLLGRKLYFWGTSSGFMDHFQNSEEGDFRKNFPNKKSLKHKQMDMQAMYKAGRIYILRACSNVLIELILYTKKWAANSVVLFNV